MKSKKYKSGLRYYITTLLVVTVSDYSKNTKYGNNSQWSLGPNFWNSLPSEIKKETDCEKSKIHIHC